VGHGREGGGGGGGAERRGRDGGMNGGTEGRRKGRRDGQKLNDRENAWHAIKLPGEFEFTNRTANISEASWSP
jgi:hypothetical protein